MIYIDHNTTPVLVEKFPNGEINVSLNKMNLSPMSQQIVINWDTINPSESASIHDELMWIMLFVNAVKNTQHYFVNKAVKDNIILAMNMLPYARQDRAMSNATPASNKVMINLLNELGFSAIFVNDIHSDSSRVLFNDGLMIEKTQQECFLNMVDEKEMFTPDEQVVFISHDAGAYKKIYDVSVSVAKAFDKTHYPIISAQKHRDVQTGKITETHINLIQELDLMGLDYNKPVKLIVVDDICDGGRTFIELGKAIQKEIESQNKWKVAPHLYVTHGLFTKGKDELKQFYGDKIYAYSELFYF